MRGIALYPRLKQLLIADRYRFRVTSSPIDWARATFLNLSFWSAEDTADVLVGRSIPADVVTHVAWHHLARRGLGEAASTVDGALLGESIASAFDLYLIGRLVVAAPRSSFLEEKIEALRELVPAPRLARLLGRCAADPARAFSDLRELLFAVGTSLVRARGIDDAARRLGAYDAHPLAPLLPHYNVSNWILHARAHGGTPPPRVDARIAKVERALRAAPVALDWLAARWLAPTEAPRP